MFIDEKELRVTAGKGGDGAALFRHEKYVPYGGPDGGDGGRGGDVILEGQGNLNALAHLAHVDVIAAKAGDRGGHSRSSGADGDDSIILVPLGTEIYEMVKGEWKLLLEFTEQGQTYRIVKGGNGGWGNWHYKSSIQQAPERANPGLPGEEKQIKLVLKLIADVGLVGFPNAGKSTFLSVVSAAQPKIADYPFTTLEPQLGVAIIGKGKDQRTLVIADLPGLIEGASDGKGLGAKFLRHIERTKLILHCIALEGDAQQLAEKYYQIRKELETWSPVLAEKEEKIVLTKADILDPELCDMIADEFTQIVGKRPAIISAASHQGVTELLTEL